MYRKKKVDTHNIHILVAFLYSFPSFFQEKEVSIIKYIMVFFFFQFCVNSFQVAPEGTHCKKLAL